MFEGLVAGLLNQYLGQYFQNLDSDNLNVGIFSGNVELTDLLLKPEALFELDLPIEVKAGYVGKISAQIPWTNLYTNPVVVLVEDVYILAGPVADRRYDPTRERCLQQAIKRKKLNELAGIQVPVESETTTGQEGGSFLEKLTATIVNNVQVSIQRIHIRYEDKLTNPDHPFACGIMMKMLSAETTNSQWQTTQVDASATLIHKLAKMDGLSVYWNPYLPEHSLVRSKLHTSAWRNLLKSSIDTLKIMDEEFDFILKPVHASAKVMLNRDDNSNMPKLMTDFILQEIEILISRQQYLNILSLMDSFKMMAVNQRYRKYSPGMPIRGHAKVWWRYAYTVVIEEYIRPFSWRKIKAHRQKYRRYKNLYKQKLNNPESENVRKQLLELEDDLDIANIIMARENAKLEMTHEVPERAKKKKKVQSWWSWMWSSTDSDQEEILIDRPSDLPSWLSKLTNEEREKLYSSIGYDENKNIEHSPQYVAHKFSFHLNCCSISLVNYGKEVLKISVAELITSLQHRPDSDGFRAVARTDSFVVEGVSIEHELVPLITSDIGVYAPSILSQVFNFELEKNPIHVDADFGIRLNVQPVEIVYDEHAVTEVIAFFQMPHISVDDVKGMAQAGWNRISEISRAGLQYAIENHKTIHVSVNMRSPYIVIPEYGTLHRGGNVLVIDLGKLKVESDLQVKNVRLEDLTMSEIESRLYDKFNIIITEVKALLADSGDDWHTAQTRPDSGYHILPSVGMQLSFFNTVKPEYAQLPQQKLEAKLPTLKLHLSDEKIQMLADFFKHIPVPHSNSMMGLDDSVDGAHIEPISPIMDDKEIQIEPTVRQLRRMKRAVVKNSAIRNKSQNKERKQRFSAMSTDSEYYYSASDHSDEEIDEWPKNMDVPTVDDHTSLTNTIKVLGRFTLGEVVVQISKSSDKIDTPYLMFRINRLCADVAVTAHGMVLHARLGGIQLVDKIHLGVSGEYLEVLGSKYGTDLIFLVYRKVNLTCPDFDTVYRGVEQGIVAKISSLRLTFDRAAILYLNSFIQGLILSTQGGIMTSNLRKSTSTILSGPTAEQHHPEPPSFIERLTSQVNGLDVCKFDCESGLTLTIHQFVTDGGPTPSTKVHAVARLDDLEMRLCENENEFADIQVKGLEGKLVMRSNKTIFQAKLSDLSIEDLTENTLYPRVLTIEDDKAFDLKFINQPKKVPMYGVNTQPSVDSSLRLRIGRMHCVFLYKFLSEMTNFAEPFLNRELTEAYRIAAQQAVHNKIQDVQEQGTKISLNLDIRAPTILVPQNSCSASIIVLQLGDFRLRNYFEDSEIGDGVLQHWDHMYLNLDAVQVIRGKLNLNGNVEHVHTLVEPISCRLDVKRALPPHHTDSHYMLIAELNSIKIQVTQQDLKVMMAMLRGNLNEVSNKPEKVDESDLKPMIDRELMMQESMETTTPVVEIEEPLLSAPEVSELVKQTSFSFILDGVTLTLLTEDEDPLAPSSPVKDESDGEGLSRFQIGKLEITGLLSNDGSLEVELHLLSVAMDDIREHSNLAVKRMVHSSLPGLTKEDNIPPMVSVRYKQSAEGNRHLDIILEALRVNVCVPYLLMVTHFFTDGLRLPDHSVDVPDTQINGRKRVSRQSSILQPPRPLQDSTLTVFSKFKQPEIVLFADPTMKNSRVLVLKTNMVLDYFCVQDRENLEAKVKQLQVISGVYGKSSPHSMVLRSCDIDFSRVRESSESELKMEMKISDVYLHMSATTAHICLGIMDILNDSGVQEPRETHDSSLGSNRHYDLWHVKTISTEPWLQHQEGDNSLPSVVIPAKYPVESFHVDMKKLQVMFEVENRDYHVPRLCIVSSVQADLHDWTTQLRASGKLHLNIDYYNEKLAMWEPLLEPVMEVESSYRPWEVQVKVVRARSHPIASSQIDLTWERDDEIDGDVQYMMARARTKSSSSDTDTDSETEMTIIRPQRTRRVRHGSDRSFDSVAHHSSIQGESDSDPEILNTISSNLDSMFSSDSSDADMSSEEVFESSDKPVFLTARGPVHVNSESGKDVIDAPINEEGFQECMYLVVDSRDPLHLNLTPQALDIIKEVSETLIRSESSELTSIHDLPGFEMFNETGVMAKVSLAPDMQVLRLQKHLTSNRSCLLRSQSQMYECNLHGLTLSSKSSSPDDLENSRTKYQDEKDTDETDGLNFLSRALAHSGHALMTAAAFVYDEGEDETYHSRQDLQKGKMHIKIEGFDDLYNISHRRAVTKLLPLVPCKNNTNYCITYHMNVIHGRKVATVRSPLKIENHLTVSMEIYCLTDELHRYSGNNLGCEKGDYTLLTVIEPGLSYSVPLYVTYHCRLYGAPANIGYHKTQAAIRWQDLGVAKDKNKTFSCLPENSEHKPFYFKVFCDDGPAKRTSLSLPKVIPHYTYHLYPPVVIHNLLPYDIQFSLENSSPGCLNHGENTPLYTADLTQAPRLQFQVCEYLGVDWTGFLDLTSDLEEFKAINMEADKNVEGLKKQLALSIQVSSTHSMDLFVYSPYWIINKTGLPVQIRGSRSDAVFENDFSQEPLLFRFKKHKRKKAKLKVYNSKWTHSFSLDTVGSSGVVICNDKERTRKYQFLIQIQLSNLKLTKILTIMPYFLVVNKTSHHLRYMEENEQADLWLDIAPHSCAAFWPVTDSLKMHVKYQDSSVDSQYFHIHKPHSSVLRMDKGTALCVEVAGGTETSVTITFRPYEHGDAPVRIDNLCEDVFIKLHQKNQSQVSLLSPCQSVLYTWDNPTTERTLMWNVYNRKKPSYPAFMLKDGFGQVSLGIQTIRHSGMLGRSTNGARGKEKIRQPSEHVDSSTDDDSDVEIRSGQPSKRLLKSTRTDKVVVYWVCYLDGVQRVLLFTQDERIASKARKVNEAEQATLALFVSLGDIGVSLVNGLYEEVAYVTLSSAAAMWEVEVKNKWKTLNMELASWLEEKWQSDERKSHLEDFVEANLESMVMKKPFIGALRRNYSPALWLQYRFSKHHTNLHAKIHRLQIDNQLSDAYFPTVLYPCPMPPYLVRKNGPKSFIELAFLRRQVPENNIDTFKYCKLLVQEFNVSVDKGFMMSLYDIIASRQKVQQESEQLQADLTLVHRTLRDLAAVQSASRLQRVVFEYIHLSPLKMRVSFSLDGRVHAMKRHVSSVSSDIVDFFLNSVGATLTEIKEVELRMAYYEREGVILTLPQLMSDIQSHYTSQAVKQAYVLILGLDVLGNPYGLIKDFTQGLGDFFYEPFLGSIQGVDKFSESLLRGMRSLLGHTVGSAAGSVSLITGSLGKGLAMLSFDKRYRKRRVQLLQQHPRHLPHSLYLAGKGFVMGVALGLSGVIVNPVRGAHEEGVEGFFKGVGKGLMGLLTKPTGGAVDMVSMAFDGIKRAAEMGEDVVFRVRLPRYIHPHLGVKPYSPYQAVGRRILYGIAKGKYLASDVYWAHAALSRLDKSDVALITDTRVLLLEKCKFWGDWDVQWDIPLTDIIGVPAVNDNRLIFKVNKDDSGLNLFTSDEHEIVCEDQQVLKWLQKKMETAIALTKQ